MREEDEVTEDDTKVAWEKKKKSMLIWTPKLCTVLYRSIVGFF